MSALAVFYPNNHPPAIDMSDLQRRYLTPPHAGAVEDHQDGALL
jgi:hypothetical protein